MTARRVTGAALSPTISLAVSEDAFQGRVIDLAKYLGWRVTHFRPAIVNADSGRRATAVQGHKGCPDLILARGGLVWLVELKTETGQASADQKAWLAAAGENGALWRPRHWRFIQLALRGHYTDPRPERAAA